MARTQLYTNPLERSLRTQFTRSRAQAHFRNEIWSLTWEDFFYIWTQDSNYRYRGRGPNNLCLARLDPQGPWSWDNVLIEPRRNHLQRIYLGVPKKLKIANTVANTRPRP